MGLEIMALDVGELQRHLIEMGHVVDEDFGLLMVMDLGLGLYCAEIHLHTSAQLDSVVVGSKGYYD